MSNLNNSENVYFIRHNLCDGDDYRDIEKLRRGKRISLRFDRKPWSVVFDEAKGVPNETHLKKSQCTVKTYRSALKYFNRLSKEGGYIFAEYLSGELNSKTKNPKEVPRGIVLSKVKKGTKVLPDSGYGVTMALDTNFYHELLYSEYPVLLAIRPPFQTICIPQYDTYREIANYKISNKKPVPSTKLLHPSMVEQMCVEYLRMKGLNGKTLAYCILNPGKSLATIDVCGVMTSSEKIYAQVKNSTISQVDLDAFIAFTKENKSGLNVVFSKDKSLPQNTPKHVMLKNVDDVLLELKTDHLTMLNNMIGF